MTTAKSSATDRSLDIIPESIATLVERLHEAANQEGLSRNARLKTVFAVRRAIVPRRTPGKKKDKRLDQAYSDYHSGMRGLKLYRKHIPNFQKMSRWRRKVEERRLLGNLQKRTERERKRKQHTSLVAGHALST